MRRSYDVKTSYLKIGAIVLLCVVLIFCGIVLLNKWEENRGRFPEQDFGDPTIEYNGIKYALKENVETFLVLGLDKLEGEGSASDSYNNDKQSDFLMLLVFDNASKHVSAIHINRDTMVPVNVLGVAGNKIDTVTKQIALSHTYGNGRDVSCRNVAESVSSLLMGMKVNHYISSTMDSVSILNDLVGGVEVEVLDDFGGIDDTLIKGERVTLMGDQALTYIRARKNVGDETNVSRMKRQQQYIRSLRDSLDRCAANDKEFVAGAIVKMAEYIISDRSATQLQTLAEKFAEYEFDGIMEIDGESSVKNGFVEFYASEDAIKELIIELFYSPAK